MVRRIQGCYANAVILKCVPRPGGSDYYCSSLTLIFCCPHSNHSFNLNNSVFLYPSCIYLFNYSFILVQAHEHLFFGLYIILSLIILLLKLFHLWLLEVLSYWLMYPFEISLPSNTPNCFNFFL